MDFSGPGIVYVLFLIPAIFAITVFIQAIGKLASGASDGPVALVFGIVLLILVAATYVLFIR